MKAKAICAYCGKVGKSREHIFPTWLLKKTPTYGVKFSKIKQKVSPNENVVHDVCKTCNNGPLSQLDDYCHKLYDSYFSKLADGKLEFKYDFAKLTRWLLKVSFNSARQQKSSVESFESLIPYMLGEDAGPPDRVLFLVEVVKPFDGIWGDKHVVIEPREHRCGIVHFKNRPAFVFIREGRFVAIDSFYFYIIFLHAPADETVYQEIKADFPASCVRLKPTAHSVELQPERDYFDVKLPDIRMNRDAYLEGYRRYLSQEDNTPQK